MTVQKSRKNPVNLCENDSQALRILLLGAVFAFSDPLSVSQGEVQARAFDSTAAAPMIGGWWRTLVRPDRAGDTSRSAPGVQVEKQPMSLPGAEAQPSESEKQAQDSEHPAQATPNPVLPTPNAAQATPTPPAPNAAEAAPSATQPAPKAAQATAPGARRVNEIDEYLWNVYQRSGTKRDSTGDFTWKDEAAAARLGLLTKEYVIGGMDWDFRELLYDLGHAMDADGINWTILSAFRDDYRQGIASGFKAHRGYSFHGGSVATGGYGHGCAADLAGSDGSDSSDAVWKWLDQHGEQFRIHRPMRQSDPAHIQPFGGWHDVAAQLRDKRVEFSLAALPSGTANTEVDGHIAPAVESHSGVSEAQFECVRSHRHGVEHLRTAGLSDHLKRHMVRVLTFDRHHRHGRWRMLADIRSPEKRSGAEASPNADELRRSAKLRTAADVRSPEKRRGADASPDTDELRRNAKWHTAGDIRNPEKRPAAEPLLNTDDTRRNAKLRTAADIRSPQKRPAAESLLDAERTHRNGRSRFADMRGPQRRAAAEALRRHARSKSHIHFVGPVFDSARKRS